MGFSVLMATYGRDNPAYLAEALESLVHQTVLPDEVILVEDGPLGMALREVIEAYRSRLPLLSVVMPGNVGLARALNEGLGAAHHELVARFDSDDVADPGRFARQLAAFAEGAKRLACFVPLLRSMLPMALRHPVYRLLSRFDPRRGA